MSVNSLLRKTLTASEAENLARVITEEENHFEENTFSYGSAKNFCRHPLELKN